MFYKIYFWFFAASTAFSLISLGMRLSTATPWLYLNFVFSVFATLALYQYAFGKPLFPAGFWKVFFFLFLVNYLYQIYQVQVTTSASFPDNGAVTSVILLVVVLLYIPVFTSMRRLAGFGNK